MSVTNLPETGFLRLSQIIGDPKADPPVPALLPVSRSHWYEGVRSGRYPKPLNVFGKRIAVYRVEDVRRLLQQGSAQLEKCSEDQNGLD